MIWILLIRMHIPYDLLAIISAYCGLSRWQNMTTISRKTFRLGYLYTYIISLDKIDIINLFVYGCYQDLVELVGNCLKNPLIEFNKCAISSRSCHIIRTVSGKGYINILRLLLADGRIDPGDYHNCVIKWATKMGQLEIIKLLLSDPRVNPGDRKNKALRTASSRGLIQIVKLFLADPRVDPADNYNMALAVACKKGRLEVVKLLLADPRINPADHHHNSPLRKAIYYGYPEILKILLADKRINPVFVGDAFETLAQHGFVEETRILLADGRINPSQSDNYAIKIAYERGAYGVFQLLFADPRVKNTLTRKEKKFFVRGRTPLIRTRTKK